MENGSYFSLDAEDSELLSQIRTSVTESKKFWLEDKNLKEIRQDNLKYWLPEANRGKQVFEFQKDNIYLDPRIFVSIETIASTINARVPQPVVSPSQDSPTAQQLADDVGKGLYGYATKYRVNDLFRVAFRNGMIFREAYLKLRFDPNKNKIGEIVTEFIPPEDIIVDKDAVFDKSPKSIAHIIKDKTYAELIDMFPEMDQKIMELAGLKRKDKSGKIVAYKSVLAKICNIYEIWLQARVNGKLVPAVVWVDEYYRLILGKQKNPNFNYDDDPTSTGNILDNPEPPFIPYNHLNTGRYFIDDTSMIEQAKYHQNIINKRGFQIGENASASAGGTVYNTALIKKEEVSRLVGDPNEKIGVKGDVRMAFNRIPIPPLSPVVFTMLQDSRSQIDDLFGTHDISRGKDSGNQTLGQDQLQVQQDYTRMDDMARAIERMATKYYTYLAQMMKVYYTEEHWFRLKGEDGKYDFVMMRSDKISDGIDIEIESGSTMPMNKTAQQKFVTQLAQMGLIDPLTLYEVGAGASLPNPQKMLERLISFRSNPIEYAGLVDKDKIDRQALMDIQILNRGQMPDVPKDVTPEYLTYFNEYMLTGEFEAVVADNPDIKVLYERYLAGVRVMVQHQIEKLSTQMPTQQDLNMASQGQQVQEQPIV